MPRVESTRRDVGILTVSRYAGYAFAFILFGIISIAMIPNQFFVVSTRAVVNAPVQVISAPIYGRVSRIDLQIGQSVTPGQVAAAMTNPNIDQTSLTGLRLERLDLTERLNNRTDTLKQRQSQLETLKAQIEAVKGAVVSELNMVVENAAATVNLYQARVDEQDALLEQQTTLAKKGIVRETSYAPLKQKRNAAQFELDAALAELRRYKLVQELVRQDIYTGSSVSNDLSQLEIQRKALVASISEDEVELRQMQDRFKELERLIGREEKRVDGSETANAVAEHAGQIVSVDASYGQFVTQGQPIARSLNCSEAFVAAVYSARDVADVPIGTKALVNMRSIGKKRGGTVTKIVRFFETNSESRYFERFPKAEANDVYVLVRLDDEPGAAGSADGNDRFFGCHVGDEVIVSLGETLISKVSTLYAAVKSAVWSRQVALASEAPGPDGGTRGPRVGKLVE